MLIWARVIVSLILVIRIVDRANIVSRLATSIPVIIKTLIIKDRIDIRKDMWIKIIHGNLTNLIIRNIAININININIRIDMKIDI